MIRLGMNCRICSTSNNVGGLNAAALDAEGVTGYYGSECSWTECSWTECCGTE